MGSICCKLTPLDTQKQQRRATAPYISQEASTPVNFIKHQFRKVCNDYEINPKSHGQGLYGTIKKCRHRRSGLQYAVKEISKLGLPEWYASTGMKNQIELLKEIDHPCVLRVHELYEDRHNFYIIMDFYSGGDLIDKVIENGQIQESEAAIISWQILSAIAYLHSKQIAHRDIKPENIVFEDNEKSLTVKIVDFDSAIRSFSSLKTKVGTLEYMAPEVLSQNYTQQCDMWSFGVLIYVLLSGNSPFGASTPDLTKLRIAKGQFEISSRVWHGISSEAKDLIQKLLVIDPNKRLSASEALLHPWIQSGSTHNTEVISTLMRVKDFSNKNKVKEVLYTYILSHIIEFEHLKSLRIAFQELDYNADGKLSKAEVLYFLNRNMDINAAAEMLNVIFDNGDSDKNGYLEYSEFLRATIERNKLLSEENVEKAFKMIDVVGEDNVSYEELRQAVGKDVSESIFSEMICMIDRNRTGIINYQQFKEFLL